MLVKEKGTEFVYEGVYKSLLIPTLLYRSETIVWGERER